MLFLYAFVASVLATAGLAQTIADEVALLPACGFACIKSAVIAAGCATNDFGCMCGTARTTVRMLAIPCITSTCSTSDALKIQPITLEICALEAAQNASSSASSSTTTGFISSASSSGLMTSTLSSSGSSQTISFSSAPTTLSSSTTAAILPFSTGKTAESASPSSSRIPAPSLSKGAIIGIAIGSTLGGLLLLALMGALVFGYRKRNRDMKHLAGLSADEKILGRHELCDANARTAQNDQT